MANEFISEVEKIGSWFSKVFKHVPAWSVQASAALNVAAPIVEEIILVADPALAVEADPIIKVIQVDLGTVSSLLSSGSTLNLATLLSAIKSNFSTLLSEAKVTDPVSVAKANTALAIFDSIVALIPAS